MSNQFARNKNSKYIGPYISTWTLSADDPSGDTLSHSVSFDTIANDLLNGSIVLNTSTHTFTCQQAGTYVINYDLRFAPSAVGDRQSYINFSGSQRGAFKVRATAAGNTIMSGTWIGWLNVGTPFNLVSVQDSGGSLDITQTGTSITIAHLG
jgi:hypothetical protein